MALRLLLALALLFACSCGRGFSSHGQAYAGLADPQELMLALDDEVLAVGSRGTSGGSSVGPSGWNSSYRTTAWFTCEPKDRAAIEDELFELVQEDIFGAGFFLVEDAAALQRYPTSDPLRKGATVMTFAWEATGSQGGLVLSVNAGSSPEEFITTWDFEESSL
ncbi:MAG: hypothetical protein P1V81_00925 [Planctomycetota bacterium]|nr:hypothetical protein [Planctomycetota bacterium]